MMDGNEHQPPPDDAARAARPPILTICIPNYNGDRTGVLEICLRALRPTLEGLDARVIVGDDASTDGSAAILTRWARKWPALSWFRRDRNGGFVKNANDCLIRALRTKAPYVGLLNSDALAMGRPWEKLILTLEQAPDAGAVNPMGNEVEQFVQRAQGDTRIAGLLTTGIEHREAFMERFVEAAHGETFFEMPEICFFACLFKREALDKVGLLDESFGIGLFDDTDWSLRAQADGFKLYLSTTAYIHHEEHRTFSVFYPDWNPRFTVPNRKWLILKHGEEAVNRWYAARGWRSPHLGGAPPEAPA